MEPDLSEERLSEIVRTADCESAKCNYSTAQEVIRVIPTLVEEIRRLRSGYRWILKNRSRTTSTYSELVSAKQTAKRMLAWEKALEVEK